MRSTALLAVLLLTALVGLGVRQLLGKGRADDAYRAAERSYRAGDLEGGREGCVRALLWNPRHVSALALRTEIDIVLGRSPDLTGDSTQHVTSALVRMDEALARASSGEDPKRWLLQVLELAKWLPDGVEVKSRVYRARGLLHSLQCRGAVVGP